MRPKTGAVLAHAPAFLLEAAGFCDGIEHLLRLACGPVFLGVESREMAADDFLRQVTLDTLRARIPVGDLAVLVEQIDRVVRHALHQQPELFLACPQRVFGRLALGQVARDLGEADKLARRQIHRIDDHGGPEPRAVLAHAPAFSLELAGPQRLFQRAPRKVGRPVFFRVEPREMLPDDFMGRIALEALGARIPARHHAGGIEHVDGVIVDRLDQQAITAIFRQGGAKALLNVRHCPALRKQVAPQPNSPGRPKFQETRAGSGSPDGPIGLNPKSGLNPVRVAKLQFYSRGE